MVRSMGDLVRPGSYRLHSRFSHAINFIDGNALIAVVDGSVGAGPVNIVAADLAEWEFVDLEIGNGGIRAAGQELPLRDAPIYDSSLRVPDAVDPFLLKANLATLRNHLTRTATADSLAFLLGENPVAPLTRDFDNALRLRYVEAAELVKQGRTGEAVARVKGLGRGLTPSGDDFVAGLLFALHLRGRMFGEPVRQQVEGILVAAQSGNPFSRALLDCAAQGRAFERLKHLVASLFAADTGLIEACAKRLAAVGATSGADIATGLVFGLAQRGAKHGRT
ncbi:MAG TPA: DUF2877 domain-containing protein [Candidatus Edwardsbacteria bacterium]|nr:DUF2877 domain-containing protein [Candidatus Edwardsbacteria bacterium]